MSSLIIDSGSTKADWYYIYENQHLQWSSPGLNPRILSALHLAEAIKENLTRIPAHRPVNIYFYGAGCSDDDTKILIADIFKKSDIDNAEINVANDLMAAARACLGKESGIVGILGTGSTAGWYDGQQFIDYITSGGYLFGDEGSAFHIGQTLIHQIIRRKIGIADKAKILSKIEMNEDEWLKEIYQHKKVNSYVASFAPLVELFSEGSRNKLLDKVFSSFIGERIKAIAAAKSYEVSLVGSVAWHHRTRIRNLLLAEGYELKNVLQKPIEALALYHQNE